MRLKDMKCEFKYWMGSMTLIEFLIVIAIMGIIVAALFK